jgi:hypothetical protein
MSSPLSDTGKQMAIAEAAAKAAIAESESSESMRLVAREEVVAHRLSCIEGPMGELKESLSDLTLSFSTWKVEVQTEIRAAKMWVGVLVFLLSVLGPALTLAAKAWVGQSQKHSSVDLISSAHAAVGTQDGGTP